MCLFKQDQSKEINDQASQQRAQKFASLQLQTQISAGDNIAERKKPSEL